MTSLRQEAPTTTFDAVIVVEIRGQRDLYLALTHVLLDQYRRKDAIVEYPGMRAGWVTGGRFAFYAKDETKLRELMAEARERVKALPA